MIGAAQAHDLRPGAVTLREVAPDVFQVRLVPPLDGAGVRRLDPPELPEGCRYTRPDAVRCAAGLNGDLRMPALARRRVKVLVHVRWLDGRRFEAILREGETRITIADAAFGVGMIRLGVEHILVGIDHLLFVLALALVAGTTRRIAIAVTGFTVAHSLTLAATALGVVHPPGAATELIIAASVLFLAAEAARARPTLTTRHPIAVALLFGGVHGFGFAGALSTLGIPANAMVPTLLAFNIGVELGQIGVLAVALLGARAVGRWVPRRVASYAIGITAGIWTVERAVAWW